MRVLKNELIQQGTEVRMRLVGLGEHHNLQSNYNYFLYLCFLFYFQHRLLEPGHTRHVDPEFPVPQHDRHSLLQLHPRDKAGV